jgi:hypothetical protein
MESVGITRSGAKNRPHVGLKGQRNGKLNCREACFVVLLLQMFFAVERLTSVPQCARILLAYASCYASIEWEVTTPANTKAR